MDVDLADVTWFRSSFSGGNSDNCVEAAFLDGGGIVLRDSRDRNQPPLIFDRGEWAAFLSGVQAGEFRQQ